MRTTSLASVAASVFGDEWGEPASWINSASGARAIEQAPSAAILINSVLDMSALGQVSVFTPTVGEFSKANVSFVSSVEVAADARIVITLPGMSTCSDGYGNVGTSIVQHLVIETIYVFNADGSDAVAPVEVGSDKQVSSTDSDGLCASNPSDTCYNRCKAIDSDWGVLGQYRSMIEMMPGFLIPANKRVVVEMTQVRMPALTGFSGDVEVKIMGASAACSIIQVALVGPGTCQQDIGTFGAFGVQPAVMPAASAKVYTPHTIHHTLHTTHYALHTTHTTPSPLNPNPQTPNPKPQTPHPTPQTPNPEATPHTRCHRGRSPWRRAPSTTCSSTPRQASPRGGRSR